RLDDAPRHLDSKREPTTSWQLMQTEKAVLAAPSIVGRGADCTWSVLEVMSRTESVQQPRGRQSPVDAPRLCTRKAVRADVLKQHLAGQGAQRVSGAAEPAIEDDQVKAVRSDGRTRKTSHRDISEELVGLRNWPLLGVDQLPLASLVQPK